MANTTNLEALVTSNLAFTTPSPLVNAALDIGTAELVALAVNLGAIHAANVFGGSTAVLAASGPISEKVGIVLLEAIRSYSQEDDTSYLERFKSRIPNAAANLAIDGIFHDLPHGFMMAEILKNPLYFGGMLEFLNPLLQDPVGVGALTFLAALIPAITAKYLYAEIVHRRMKWRAQEFSWSQYFESRYVLTNTADSDTFFSKIALHFDLQNLNLVEINDVYFPNTHPSGGRTRNVRLRQYSVQDNELYSGKHSSRLTMEISASLKKRIRHKGNAIYYSQKEKGKHMFESGYPEIETLSPPFNKLNLAQGMELNFFRRIGYRERLRVMVDHIGIKDGLNYYVVEFKSPNLKTLLDVISNEFISSYDHNISSASKQELLNIGFEIGV